MHLYVNDVIVINENDCNSKLCLVFVFNKKFKIRGSSGCFNNDIFSKSVPSKIGSIETK